jgi:hypothetical protein
MHIKRLEGLMQKNNRTHLTRNKDFKSVDKLLAISHKSHKISE